MLRNLKFKAFLVITMLFLLDSCTADQVASPEPCEEVLSYNRGIRELIRAQCNTSGCHDGSGGVGNYNSYTGMRSVINNGNFRQEVVLEKSMPKNSTLTAEEFEILKCWSENGFPEN